jgi:hypothetical protein
MLLRAAKESQEFLGEELYATECLLNGILLSDRTFRVNDKGPPVKRYEVREMRTQPLATAAAAFLSLALAITGCSSAKSDWAKAANENTVSSYQGFLAAHPQDEHAPEAQAMILQLQDDNGWAEVKHTGTADGYQTYLQQYPQGTHSGAARDAITSIDRAAAWKTAQGEGGTAASIQAFLQKYPTGPEADQAKAKLKDLTGYRARLASESSDIKAQRKLTQLKARFGDTLHDLVVTPDASGKSFFIDSSGMTELAAKNACDAIKSKHQACEVVQL